jgi:plastocyanin
MSLRLRQATVFAALTAAYAAYAGEIHGAVIVHRRLTKRAITAPVSAYQRGVAVTLDADAEQDPLEYERSHVVIYVEGEFPSTPGFAVMEQRNRRFAPDLLVLPAGSQISFPNEDPIFHNVFSLSKPKSFDLGNYVKGQTRLVTFPKPGIVFVNCHLHPNMSAAIVITPNSWGARADASGRFRFTGMPPGDYTVVAWHKAAGFVRQTVRVDDRRPAEIEFLIPLEESAAASNAQR